MKFGANLYSNSSKIDLNKFKTMTEISMAGDVYNGIMSGLSNYFQSKSNYYLQSTQLYNESIPLYQKIGSQVREQMNQQANQYMNAGVDVSQGTAFKVVSHTQEQGTMKLNEIYNNVNTQVRNMKRISSSQATAGLIQNITNGLSGAVDKGINYLTIAQQAGAFTSMK